MARQKLDYSAYEINTLGRVTAEPDLIWEANKTREQYKQATTKGGVNIWKVEVQAFLTEDLDSVTAETLKIASVEKPEFERYTQYVLTGPAYSGEYYSYSKKESVLSIETDFPLKRAKDVAPTLPGIPVPNTEVKRPKEGN
jgi:hypothetical protein